MKNNMGTFGKKEEFKTLAKRFERLFETVLSPDQNKEVRRKGSGAMECNLNDSLFCDINLFVFMNLLFLFLLFLLSSSHDFVLSFIIISFDSSTN
jgi:hypothetical protein